jgi:hypothetical protein
MNYTRIFRKVYLTLFGVLFICCTYAQNKEDIVNTPFGPATKSNVHYVNIGHKLKYEDGQIKIVNTKSGQVDEVYGNQKNTKTSFDIKKYSNGWNTDAYNVTSNDKPFTFFSTKWIVPSPPKPRDQILYLFNALVGMDVLENGNFFYHIIQPVLQWGLSPAGGGNYWAICNWYVNDQDYFYDSLIVVNPGTILQGVLKQSSSFNGLYSYYSSFYGFPTGLQVDNLPPLTSTYIALESFNADRSDEYPTNEKIKFFDIYAETNIKKPILPWTVDMDEKTPNDLGQFTKIINPSLDGGEIEIYFRTLFPIDGFNEIHVYPNPVHALLHISPNRIKQESSLALPDIVIKNCKIEIFDSFGRIVRSLYYNILDSEFDVNLLDLKPGLYLIKFSYNNRIHTFKIIKN